MAGQGNKGRGLGGSNKNKSSSNTGSKNKGPRHGHGNKGKGGGGPSSNNIGLTISAAEKLYANQIAEGISLAQAMASNKAETIRFNDLVKDYDYGPTAISGSNNNNSTTTNKMALDQAGVNKLYNSLLGRDAVFGSESDFDADWWLGQSEADVKRGIESGSEFKNRAALVNAAGDAGISEAELDKQVMAGGMKTEFHDDYTGGSLLDFNKGNTWFDSIQNSDKFDPFGTTYAKAQNSINNSLGIGVGGNSTPTGNPITGTANAATDTLPTITDTTVTSDPYGGGVIGVGGPNAGDDVATLQQQIADLIAAGNNNSNNNNANNNANNNNNSNQQQAAASDGWWTKFADADAFRDFMSGGSSQQSGSEFDQFLKFMQALQGMGGFGGGSGYGYGGYGGFAPGGVRPNVGLNNTMNALNAFKFLGAGSDGNVQTGLLAGLGN